MNINTLKNTTTKYRIFPLPLSVSSCPYGKLSFQQLFLQIFFSIPFSFPSSSGIPIMCKLNIWILFPQVSWGSHFPSVFILSVVWIGPSFALSSSLHILSSAIPNKWLSPSSELFRFQFLYFSALEFPFVYFFKFPFLY